MHTIYIASDHGGFDIKQHLIQVLTDTRHMVHDLGTNTADISVDYPDYAHKVAEKLQQDGTAFGILVCGSGIGMSIAANRHKHIRCALVSTPELARLSRQHNNANVVAISGRFIQATTAIEIVNAFLHTDFEGGRHQKRIDMLR